MSIDSDDTGRFVPTLIIGLFLAFAAGYLVAAVGREPREPMAQIPNNWNPAAAASAETLKLCLQTIATCRAPDQGIAH